MRVYIEVASWFKKFTGGKPELELEIDGEISAIEAVKAAGIPEEEVGFITASGSMIDSRYLLADGDRIKVYPHIIGG